MSANIRLLLTLTQVPGVGPHRLRALVDHFRDPQQILEAPLRDLVAVEGVDQKTALSIRSFSRGRERIEAARYADDQIARLERVGGGIVSLWEGDYPPALRRIYDPPALLFARGTILPCDQSSIAVVGTRSPSAYGQQLAEQFASGIARAGLTVVSGLARGIDTIAHSACLRSGGRTLAVIGSGIDVLYPPENRSLAENIRSEGALLSEYPMGTKPDAGNFPRRNRIISGITLGTIVVETDCDGGAMITAATALDQNREVFALPSPINSKRQSGANRLIHDGKAVLVESVEDVLAELAPRLTPHARTPISSDALPREDLSLFERTVFDAFPDDQPVHVDLLSNRARMPVADVLVHLLALEFKGVVRQTPGKYFVRL
ncbi:MAG: DNA-processing protein DprA [Bacteroidota bacterium]